MAPQLNDILKLSVSERIILVEAIWNSIASEKQGSKKLELSNEQINILEEELADYKKNPKKGSSWEEVKARIRKKK